MNLTYLKYVVEVARVRSITKAAQNLDMGQPNLSKAIRELERELGITIFRRTSKGVIPTPQGEEFLGYAQGILSQLDELESLYKPRTGDSLSLRVAVPRAAYAAEALARFLQAQRTAGRIDIQFQETEPAAAVRLVSGGEADFGVVRYQQSQRGYFEGLIAQAGLKSELMGEFRLMILLAADHPLAGNASIDYRALAGCLEIVHGDYQTPSLSFHKIRRGAELDSHLKRIAVYDRGSQYDLLRAVPGSYLWTAPVPEEVLACNRLVQRPCSLSDAVNAEVLIMPGQGQLSPQAEQLADEFRRAVRKWEDEKNGS